jgi:N-methylhydantoinase B/oxoprolinase/acetone carboxylase alpha subunit
MTVDPFTQQIIRNYLVATAQEMVDTTVRTAYSPTFAEGHDFSCALFDNAGRMVIQSRGIGVHLGSLVGAMQAICRRYDNFVEGDIVMTNNPYLATHQPDCVVCRPMFYQGRQIGFAVNIGHWTDIGGMAPGGCAGTATHVVQEGLIIPICKLYEGGRLNQEIRDFILENVRLQEDDWGDLQSQIAATAAAESRMRSLMDRYGFEAVLDGMQETIRYSKQRFLARMTTIPNGRYTAHDVMEDDGVTDRRYDIAVTIDKRDDGFTVDFTGSSAQAPTPINATITSTRAAVYAALLALVDPTLNANAGVFELVDVIAPAGTFVNATRPAPVFGCTFEISKRVPETIVKAFAAALPDRVSAGGFGSGNNMSARFIDPATGQESLWYNFYEGGQGATAESDGNNALYFWAGTALNQPIEVWEHKYPVLVERYALVAGSGGNGTFRGGLGTVHEIRLLADHFLSGLGDRHRVAPWGVHGGEPGRPNRWLLRRNGRARELQSVFKLPSPSKFYNLPLKAGDVLIIETGGGGGYGDPRLRAPAAVARDRRDGYVVRAAEPASQRKVPAPV